jgi:hypothetical protein
LEFIDANYYLIIVAYFKNYLEFKKVISYVIKVYELIQLIAYYYQKVIRTVLEANSEGTKKLSVLGVEYCLEIKLSNNKKSETMKLKKI